jgi:hypothetical protein
MMPPQDLLRQFSPAYASRPESLPASRRRKSRHRDTLRRVSLEVLEDRIVLTSITVTSLGDSGSGSLRAAIATANGDPGNDYTIDFAVTGTIGLTDGTLELANNIDIEGPGASSLAIVRDASSGVGPFGIFAVDSNETVTISGVTIRNGVNLASGDGGGIENLGGMTVTACTISGNSASFGGGIYNAAGATAIVSGSTFAANKATGSGGGIFNADGGTATLSDSTLTGNKATDTGGGIDNEGDLTVDGGTLGGSNFADGNSATSGGGIFNASAATAIVSSSIIAANKATDTGGGIDNEGDLTVDGSTLGGNTLAEANSAASGGGVYNVGMLSLQGGSILSGNKANGAGGGIFNAAAGTATTPGLTVEANSVFSGNTAASGGGIFNAAAATATVSSSTIAANQARATGGGIDNEGTLTITGSTLGGNTPAEAHSAASGGGI